MSLAQLFYFKETFRQRVRQWRQGCFTPRKRQQRELIFEQLEPRLLLSITPMPDGNLVTLDTNLSPLRVVATSIPEGAYVLPGQPFTLTVQLSEPLDLAGLGQEDVTYNGTVGPAPTFSYNPAKNSVDLDFPGTFSIGAYQLLFQSHGQGFRDLDGNLLDGFPSHPLPSGDGIPGDPFALSFHVDSFIQNFQPAGPTGSLIYEQTAFGILDGTGDSEIWSVHLVPGQTLTAVYESLDGTETATVEVLDPFGNPVGSFSLGSPLQGLQVDQDGNYELKVISGAGTGRYRIDLLLNTAIEANDFDPGLNGNFIALNGTASRAAVMGSLSPDIGDASDSYSIFLTAGETATIVLDDGHQGNAANLSLILYGSTGIVTTGLFETSNVDQAIRNFVAPVDDTYFIDVTGFEQSDYALVVTKQASFEREPNDEPTQAKEVGPTGHVLGYISGTTGGDPFDQYLLNVQEGDILDLAVAA